MVGLMNDSTCPTHISHISTIANLTTGASVGGPSRETGFGCPKGGELLRHPNTSADTAKKLD